MQRLRNLAPLHLAEKWDNVGLLLEPTVTASVPISLVFLTNDLTEQVLDEVITLKKEKSPEHPVCVVSYHPPIFEAMKKVVTSEFKQRVCSSSTFNFPINCNVAFSDSYSLH